MLWKNAISLLSTNAAEIIKIYFGTKIISSTKIIIYAVVRIQTTGNASIG